MPSNIVITIIRTGKGPQVVEVPAGNSVSSTFNAAGFESRQYAGWHVTNEAGVRLSLDDSLQTSMVLIVGQEVAGA